MRHSLGIWTLTCLVIGNMIGSGIFLLPASLAFYGSISILAWILTAIGSIFIVLVFIKCSLLFPQSGGPYAYCRQAFGDFAGCQVAFCYWIAVWVGNAAIAVACISYLSVFFPLLNNNKYLSFIIELALLWVITLINVIGVKHAGIFQLITTILKIIPLIFIIGLGIFFISPVNLSSFNVSQEPNSIALISASTLTLWSFIGLESATVPAAYVKNPRYIIPLATIIGILITAAVYILSTTAVMGIVPMKTLVTSSAPFADAAYQLTGYWGKWLMSVGAIIACVGTLNGWILLQGQIPTAAAINKLFPAPFATLSHNHTPAFSVIISSVLVSLLLILTLRNSLVHQFSMIILMATLLSLFIYLYTSIAVIVLYWRAAKTCSRYQLISTILIACVAILYSVWAIIGAGITIIFYGILLLLSAIPFYFWVKHQKLYQSKL